MKRGYVDLARRFVPFQESADSDEAAWLSYYRPAYTDRRSIDWEELIADGSRCVVVLGEAGSGKSWEFEARAEILNSRGVAAFFLALEDLADREIDRCLNRDDDTRLKRWLEGNDRAVFFLDSLDDARLNDRRALGKVRSRPRPRSWSVPEKSVHRPVMPGERLAARFRSSIVAAFFRRS